MTAEKAFLRNEEIAVLPGLVGVADIGFSATSTKKKAQHVATTTTVDWGCVSFFSECFAEKPDYIFSFGPANPAAAGVTGESYGGISLFVLGHIVYPLLIEVS